MCPNIQRTTFILKPSYRQRTYDITKNPFCKHICNNILIKNSSHNKKTNFYNNFLSKMYCIFTKYVLTYVGIHIYQAAAR